jgi:hypothetical protein
MDRLLDRRTAHRRSRAIAITFSSWGRAVAARTEADRAPLQEAATLFREAGDRSARARR